MSAPQFSVKRRFISGQNDWRYQDTKAPVTTSEDQFIFGVKQFADPIKALGDVLCSGSYYGDGSHLTNIPPAGLEAVLTAGDTAIDKSINLEVGDFSTVITPVNLTLRQDTETLLTASPTQLSLVDPDFSLTCDSSFVELYSIVENTRTDISPALLTMNSSGNQLSIGCAQAPDIILTSPANSNTITSVGYTTKNSSQNATHYLNFSDSFATGVGAIQKSSLLSCNPATGNITATVFSGTLGGRSDNTAAINTTASNIATVCYPTFTNTAAGTARTLYVDDATAPLLTYVPSTGILSASAYTISGTPATAGVASKFGQVGLVLLQTLTGTITGAATAVNFNLPSIFNATYSSYKIVITPTVQAAFTAYPTYSIAAFLGTGTLPTQANQYGLDVTAGSNPPATMNPVFNRNVVIATSPLTFTGSALINRVVEFDIRNVGFTYTRTVVVDLTCSSFYENPGIRGTCQRVLNTEVNSGTTITGLTLTQSSISAGNSFGWTAKIYGYNNL